MNTCATTLIPSTPLPDGSGLITAGIIGDTLTRADSVALEHNWTLSAKQVNQLRFGYTRRGFDRESLRTGRSASEASRIPNIPVSAFSDTLPTYRRRRIPAAGAADERQRHFTTSVTQFVDNFSWLRGRHSLKWAPTGDLSTSDILQPPNPTGSFQFTQHSDEQSVRRRHAGCRHRATPSHRFCSDRCRTSASTSSRKR